MSKKTEATQKETVIKKANKSEKYWMTENEFTGVVVGKASTNSEYVITDGIIEPNGFVPIIITSGKIRPFT